MISKIAIALAGVLAAAPVLVPSTASAQVYPVQAAPLPNQCQWAQLADGTWACVPDVPQTYTYNETPYVYYFVPNIGWGWHVSPWGYGHAWRGRYNASYGHYTPRYLAHPQYNRGYVAPHRDNHVQHVQRSNNGHVGGHASGGHAGGHGGHR